MEGARQTLMSNFVVDASVVCCWILPDEASTSAGKAFDLLETNDAVAPDLIWHEVRNVLMLARRRKRIDFDLVAQGLHFLRRLRIVTIPSPDDHPILALAERQALTAYDAAYLALALERQLPLATLDRKLAEAAAREGVALVS